MATGIWRGVDNVARKVTNQWRGVDNVARQIKNEWRGVDNVARQCFSSKGHIIYDHGYNPYNLVAWANALPSVWNLLSFQSDHILYNKTTCDTSGYGDMAYFIWTDGELFNLPSIYNFNYLTFLVEVFETANVHAAIRFYNKNSDKSDVYIRENFYKDSGLVELQIPITDRNKSDYETLINSVGSVRVSVGLFNDATSGDDYTKITQNKYKLYGIYLQ